MFLKKIITSGFKSFADRITITLDKSHITGIVGPNGSGKSNVIDAVRWVMGEQNARMLRGEKATDIIFAGSEKRKPLGMAEVSLVFDNEDISTFCPPEYRQDQEITLTRRLYIDGEREFLINRKPVRLRDIVSFFASTGLGGRSYSMIQQGQVDRILQARPEQLREMLEEAAGTLIFKTRRQETAKKLEETAQNLDRVGDILAELERQVESLKSQVDKAEEWQRINTELRHKETELFIRNYQHLKTKREELRQEVENNSLKKIACVSEIAKLELRYEELKIRLDEADPALHALTEEISRLREKLAASEASLSSARQLLENGEAQITELSSELTEEEQSLQEIRQESEQAKERLEAAHSEKETLEESLDELLNQLEILDEEDQVYQSKISEMQEEKRQLERMLDNHRIRREALEKDFAKASRHMHEQTEKVLALEEELSHEQILLDAQKLRLANEKKGLSQESEKRAALEQQLSTEQGKLEELRQELDDCRSSWFEQKARLDSLIELERNAEGWIPPFRKLQTESSSDLCVLLSDLISLSPAFHELPETLKTAFEHWGERALVRSREELEQLTQLCHRASLSSIPVSLLQRPDLNDEFHKLAAQWNIQPLAPFLKAEKNSPHIQDFLAALWYLKSSELPEAQLLCQLPAGLVLFTETGLCMQGAYDCIISASEHHEGSLSRKDRIGELHRLVETLDEEQAKLKSSISEQEKTLSQTREAILQIEREIRDKNKDLLELMSEFKIREGKISHRQESILEVRQQYRQLEESCEAFGTELTDLKESRQALSEEKSQAAEILEDALAQCDEIRERREELKRQSDQQKIDLASAKTLAQTLAEHFHRDREKETQLLLRVEKKRESLNQLKKRIEDSGQLQQELTEEISRCLQGREQLENELNQKKEANREIVDELRQTETSLKEARDIQHKAQRELSDHELELERIHLGIEGIRQQALEKYQIDPAQDSTSLPQEDPDFSPDQARRLVGQLRSRIESFGPVNMMALEEYRELSQRREFMETQKGEIISSSELLQQAIAEIEESSRNKFLKTFHTLNEEFSSLFPVLFPRGEGQIQLTDPENPLESGVEIMVRLPGKKPQNMRLFSGGEKALTAIALIFALLKSKPTPFCFLDEVDAPLDETNVGRYNNVLEALSDRFQFIVITHRRKTMEVLDTLYGVTMQEPGVSKVVGVDLAKALPSHLQKSFSEEKRQGASAHP
ncbi:MAG: chromosome segregation protein SMC [Deltaproteobacteria bacterium]|nr:chromosome segregation protein SMC [Deltaproteobacteria bacterium]